MCVGAVRHRWGEFGGAAGCLVQLRTSPAGVAQRPLDRLGTGRWVDNKSSLHNALLGAQGRDDGYLREKIIFALKFPRFRSQIIIDNSIVIS